MKKTKITITFSLATIVIIGAVLVLLVFAGLLIFRPDNTQQPTDPADNSLYAPQEERDNFLSSLTYQSIQTNPNYCIVEKYYINPYDDNDCFAKPEHLNLSVSQLDQENFVGETGIIDVNDSLKIKAFVQVACVSIEDGFSTYPSQQAKEAREFYDSIVDSSVRQSTIMSTSPDPQPDPPPPGYTKEDPEYSLINAFSQYLKKNKIDVSQFKMTDESFEEYARKHPTDWCHNSNVFINTVDDYHYKTNQGCSEIKKVESSIDENSIESMVDGQMLTASAFRPVYRKPRNHDCQVDSREIDVLFAKSESVISDQHFLAPFNANFESLDFRVDFQEIQQAKPNKVEIPVSVKLYSNQTSKNQW